VRCPIGSPWQFDGDRWAWRYVAISPTPPHKWSGGEVIALCLFVGAAVRDDEVLDGVDG
jgi:hypothetical protein